MKRIPIRQIREQHCDICKREQELLLDIRKNGGLNKEQREIVNREYAKIKEERNA